MQRAHLLIRPEPHYRRDSFARGLIACGYEIAGQPREPMRPGDVLVIWNRYGRNHELAKKAAAEGARVIVAENGLLGRDRPDGWHWYSLALNGPAAGGGRLAEPLAGEDRTRAMGVNFGEWRRAGTEVIVLEQRGIGPPGIASPPRWNQDANLKARAQTDRPVRNRAHPGEGAAIPVEEDLRNAWCVCTWSSGAALKALAMGVPVFYSLPAWIGRGAASLWAPEKDALEAVVCDDGQRTATFEKVGRACWRTDEIETGYPFARLLGQWPSTRSAATTARSSAAT